MKKSSEALKQELVMTDAQIQKSDKKEQQASSQDSKNHIQKLQPVKPNITVDPGGCRPTGT